MRFAGLEFRPDFLLGVGGEVFEIDEEAGAG